MKFSTPGRRPTKGRKGQVLVEFALSIVILVVILGGVVDVGLLVWKANMLNQAVREGALFATRIRNDAGDWKSTDTDKVSSYIRGVNPVFGDPAKTSIQITPETSSDRFDTAAGGAIRVGCIAVTITHTHEFITPFNTFGGDEVDITRTYRVPFLENLIEE